MTHCVPLVIGWRYLFGGRGLSMKALLAMKGMAVWLASPPVAAQVSSWYPLKDVENALPAGMPNESKTDSIVHDSQDRS